jgi:hypothetical protein
MPVRSPSRYLYPCLYAIIEPPLESFVYNDRMWGQDVPSSPVAAREVIRKGKRLRVDGDEFELMLPVSDLPLPAELSLMLLD